MKLILASRNAHKLEEIKEILPAHIELFSLDDIHFTEELPETSGTIEGNAIEKAEYLHKSTGLDCFADDSGLEVDELNGAPGVDTAFYAGPERDSLKNNQKLLDELKNKSHRSARFVTVIAAIIKGKTLLFEGEIKGSIADKICGSGGFGYDPVFIPEGYSKTFAELPLEVKNQISHRARAVKKLTDYIKSLDG